MATLSNLELMVLLYHSSDVASASPEDVNKAEQYLIERGLLELQDDGSYSLKERGTVYTNTLHSVPLPSAKIVWECDPVRGRDRSYLFDQDHRKEA